MKQTKFLVLVPLFFSLGLIFCILSNQLVKAAPTATIILDVDTTSDTNTAVYQACTVAPNDCSLRGAISKANADSDNDYIINVPAGTYTFILGGSREDNNATGDLDFLGNINLIGAGTDVTTIDAGQLDRAIQVANSATVTLRNITITNGKTPDGAIGTAGNTGGSGENGGGISNAGVLTMTHTILMENRTGSGGEGGGGTGGFPCMIAGSGGSGGTGGSGAGIYNSGVLNIEKSTLSGNLTGTGGEGGIPGYCPSPPISSGTGGPGGVGGHGAAIFNASGGLLTITNSTMDNNLTGNGGNTQDHFTGPGPFVGGGDAGSGGGIYNQGSLTISNSTFSSNATGNGGDGYYPGFTDGAIAGIAGHGGGIYNLGTVTVTHATLTLNQIGNVGIGDPPATAGSGGGLYQSGGSLQVMNSLIVNNDMPTADSSDDCHGSITSLGYNLVGVGTGCPSNGGGDQTTTNPQMGALADNGGATFTHALLTGSPAINQIANGVNGCNAGTSHDQRDAVRADGAGRGGTQCDSGAYEYDSGETPTAVTLVSLSAGMTTAVPFLLSSLIVLTILAGRQWRRRPSARK